MNINQMWDGFLAFDTRFKARMEWRDLMSQYRRIVSYLYQYLDGEKGQNIGYVRLEQKGRQCRIAVQMRAIKTNFMPEVWLFKQKSSGMMYISIGKLLAYSGNLQIKAVTNADDVCSSGYPASDFDGAIIYISDKEYYATTWTNENIYIGEKINMLNSSKKDVNNKNSTNILEDIKNSTENKETESSVKPKDSANEEVESETIESKEQDKVNQDSTDKQGLKDSVNDTNDVDDASIQITDVESDADVRTQDIRAEDKPTYACGACPFKNYKKNDEDFGMRILKNFPVMYPFKSGDIEESVRIEPKDIGCMPIRLWAFANNRFLLHGYYCYKHLIFARLNRGCYALGVPGIYSEEESKKAASFSFNEFQPIGPGKTMYGVFGYWFTEIHV